MRSLVRRTVLVTRAEEDARSWVERLEALGARAVTLPCLVCEPIDDAATAEALRTHLADADWVAFTSRRGVAAAERLLDGALPARVRVAAVGEATAAEAGARFGRVDFTASGTGEALAHSLAEMLAPATDATDGGARPKVVVAAADRALRHLERVLEPLGVTVARVAVYRTTPAAPAAEKADLSALGVDTVLLASPSAVEGLTHLAEIPEHVSVISIGPSTTKAAHDAGIRVTRQAAHPDLEGMVEVIP